jgi:hypothetical protein
VSVERSAAATDERPTAATPIPAISAARSASSARIPAPAPVEDGLDDWAAGFAVSSADQTANR